MMQNIKEKLLHYTWDLAYGHYSDLVLTDGLLKRNYTVVKNPYKDKWFADPFIYKDFHEYLELFVEEFDFSVGRGRIGHLVISKKTNKIEKLSIILEKGTHLSFPVIYRIDGNVYVHPENSASGRSFMYRYDEEQDKLVDPIEVLAEPVTDAIIYKKGEKFEMYATKVPFPNGNELFIYQADSFFGPYEFKESRLFEKSYARMAGMIIKLSDGKTIRPAQDCDGGDYGQAVHFMEGEKVVTTWTPPDSRYAGLHTFNTLGSIFIIDLKRYDFPWLYWLKTRLK